MLQDPFLDYVSPIPLFNFELIVNNLSIDFFSDICIIKESSSIQILSFSFLLNG